MESNLYNIVYTDELKSLQDESLHMFYEYEKTNKRKIIKFAIYNEQQKLLNKPEINLFTDPSLYNSDCPEDIKQSYADARQKWEEYKVVNNKYQKLLTKNISQLINNITPQNSLSFLGDYKGRDVFYEFYHSSKTFLLLATASGTLVIIQNEFIYSPDKSIVMYQLNNPDDYYKKNKDFFDDINEQLWGYRRYFLPNKYDNPPRIKQKFIAFKKPYLLNAQSSYQSYGRTKEYLIIGFMIYK